ncbi:hypothetical protein RI129_009483 [Pyrocoelia pectoralis]|uniref:MADF domain-containing protein n=1 Tax=Pyrocoelia pectoralis TaxID=417401 RepID=A0AAN7V9F9_9COLE
MNQEQCLQLIELYKNRNFVWNPKNKNYFDRNKREDAWKEISAQLNFPLSTVKGKMKTLLGSYLSHFFCFKYGMFLSNPITYHILRVQFPKVLVRLLSENCTRCHCYADESIKTVIFKLFFHLEIGKQQRKCPTFNFIRSNLVENILLFWFSIIFLEKLIR